MKMEIIMSVRIPTSELDDKLHYKLIAETMSGSKWSTSKIKRAFQAEFSPIERETCFSIWRKARRWYLREFPTEPVEMYKTEYDLWVKLKDFIVKNFCN
jgi:hypothetical protein